MIKNILSLLLWLVTAALVLPPIAEALAEADIREEAWKCDRLLRQGYPTGKECEDVWAAEARLNNK